MSDNIGPVIKELIGFNTDEWRSRALCAGMDTNLFFDDPEDNSASHFKREYAKGICAQCPVSTECLNFAIDNDIRDGIYGGITYRNRLNIKRATGRLNVNKSHSKENDND